MIRWTVARMAVWAGLVWLWALFIYGGQVQMCLGPLGVTPESCRVQLGLPPLTDWDRFQMGPGPAIVLTLAGWLVIGFVARRKRQRAGL